MKEKQPDKVYPKNRIGTLEYIVKVPLGGLNNIEITLSEFKYLHDAYDKFAKQSGFKGFSK